MKDIKTITELIDLYEAGTIKAEGKTYPIYWTEGHKEKNLVGWIHDSEFKGWLSLRQDFDKRLKDFLWHR